MGRGVSSPPQFGHPSSIVSAQPVHQVHSKLQIIAPAASGGSALPQRSQVFFISSMGGPDGSAQRAPKPRPTLPGGRATRARPLTAPTSWPHAAGNETGCQPR